MTPVKYSLTPFVHNTINSCPTLISGNKKSFQGKYTLKVKKFKSSLI